MQRLYGRLVRRVPRLLWVALVCSEKVVSFVMTLVAIFGLGALSYLFPWWVPVATFVLFITLLFLYGLLKANYEQFQQVEKERGAMKADFQEANQERKNLRAQNEGLISENEDLIAEVDRLTKELAVRPAPPQASSPLGSYPFLQPEEFGNPRFEKRSIYIADLAREVGDLKWTNAVIKNRTFEDCRIYGPAMVTPMSDGTFDEDCRWAEGIGAFWPAPSKEAFVGVIGLEDCLFRACRLEHVAVLLSLAEYRQITEQPIDQGQGGEQPETGEHED